MRQEKNNLAKNTLALYSMNIVKLLFPLLTLPYLTRVLSTETYGVVAYVKTIISYAQLIIDFGFMLSATKQIVKSRKSKKRIGIITGNTILEKGFLGLVSTIVYMICIAAMPIMRINISFSIIYLLSILSTIFILDFLYRGIEKMSLVAIPYIITKTISTIFTLVLVKNDADIIYIPIMELLGNIIAATISIYFLKITNIKIIFRKNVGQLKSDLKDSFVFFVSNFATTFFGALTTIIVGLCLSLEEVAMWGLLMQLLSAAKSLYNPLSNSIYPYMIRKKDLSLIKKLFIYSIPFMIIGSIVALIYGDVIVLIIGGEKYIRASIALRYLLPAFIFSFYSMILGWPVLGSIGKEKETTNTTINSSIIQIIAITIVIVFGIVNLNTIAICCSITEASLLLARSVLLIKNKRFFYLKDRNI